MYYPHLPFLRLMHSPKMFAKCLQREKLVAAFRAGESPRGRILDPRCSASALMLGQPGDLGEPFAANVTGIESLSGVREPMARLKLGISHSSLTTYQDHPHQVRCVTELSSTDIALGSLLPSVHLVNVDLQVALLEERLGAALLGANRRPTSLMDPLVVVRQLAGPEM